MGIFNNFPFTNFQEKNLDCIYKLAKEANDNAADALEHVNEALTNTDSLIERSTALTEQAAQLTEAVEAGEVLTAQTMNIVDEGSYPALQQIPAQDSYGVVRHVRWRPNINSYSKLRTFLQRLNLDSEPFVLVGDVYQTITSDQSNNKAVAQSIGLFHLETMSAEAQDQDIASHYLIKYVDGWVTSYPYHIPNPGNPALVYFTNHWTFYDLTDLELDIQ